MGLGWRPGAAGVLGREVRGAGVGSLRAIVVSVVPDECYGAGGQGLPPLLHAGDVQGLWGEEEHQILNLLIYPIFYEELLTEL